MKVAALLLAIILLIWFASPGHSAPPGWNGKIMELRRGDNITIAELAEKLSNNQIIVLGEEHYEKHYSPRLQWAIAKVIKQTISAAKAGDNTALALSGKKKKNNNARKKTGGSTVAWEFLNASDQKRITEFFGKLQADEIDAYDFLNEFFENESTLGYTPIIDVAKNTGGKLIGVNLSRNDKRPVSKGGIAAAGSNIVPLGYAPGNKRYFERFKEAMKHHVSNDNQITNLFDAQCLTDDVMAYNLLKDEAKLKFLVVGGFHSDFNEGVVSRIMARSPDAKVVTVRFMNISDYTEADIRDATYNLQYGNIADYVYFIGEPKSNEPKK